MSDTDDTHLWMLTGVALLAGFVVTASIVPPIGAVGVESDSGPADSDVPPCKEAIAKIIANDLDHYDSGSANISQFVRFLWDKTDEFDSGTTDIRADLLRKALEREVDGISSETARKLADVLANKIDEYDADEDCWVTLEQILKAIWELREELESETTDVRPETVCNEIEEERDGTPTETPTPTPTETETETPPPVDTPPETPPPGTTNWDFGDAPDPTHPSLKASDGSRHADIRWIWLGPNVSAERDSRQVDNDTWDDGVVSVAPLTVELRSEGWNGTAYLNVLVDRNRDGDWDEENEWVLQNGAVTIESGERLVVETDYTVPPETWLRVTLTGAPVIEYNGTGAFAVGETEDYDVSPIDVADRDGDGAISDEELQQAVLRWAAGDLTDEQIQQIIIEWSLS